MRLLPPTLLAYTLAFGCASAEPEPRLDDEDAALQDGTPEALGVLDLLNDDATTFELLDIDVALDRRAAQNLMGARPFQTVAEVDAVRWVGSSAMNKLTQYAYAHGWVPEGDDLLGSYDGVPFTVDEALAALDLVNTAPETVLRSDVPLDRRAVNSILAARPIGSMERLADLYYVGSAMLQRIKTFVSAREIGLVSDLDRTVIPPASFGELPDEAYPGVATLYSALEGDIAGDVHYVTARPIWMIDGIPEWLEAHGVPAGTIDTGISPAVSIARGEKVADISRLFDANPDQQFVMIGDTHHVDPDAFRDIMALYPDRVLVAFVHDVKTIDAERLEGLIVYDHFGEVAEVLGDLGVLDAAAVQAINDEVSR